MMIDVRSDTVTRPTPAMLDAMHKAKVGDDVFEEDPTVAELEEFGANLFGKEAALFCPSGTMTNQIAIKLQTEPMSEVILEASSHPYLYEGGGIAFHSGASVKLIRGNRGRIDAMQVREAVNPDNVHFPATRLVSLENTANRGGGSCYDLDAIREIKSVCNEFGLKMHLDGARIFNALIATGQQPQDHGKLFDTISICLSKGLGAPVGSLLLGNREAIKKGRRIRKVFGGGMRQAGFLAAAGLYALKNNIPRLADDHEKARELENILREQKFVDEILPVETNIVVFSLKANKSPSEFLEFLAGRGVKAVPFGGQWVRFVTHLDLSREQISKIKDMICQY